jgi:hypothetical protein
MRAKPHGIASVDLDGKLEVHSQFSYWHVSTAAGCDRAVADTFTGDIYRVDLTTGEKRLVTAGHRKERRGLHPHVTLHPRGDRALFISHWLGSPDLMLAALPRGRKDSGGVADLPPVPDWIRQLQVPRPPAGSGRAALEPDLMKRSDGSRVAAPSDWKRRRREIHKKWLAFLGRLPEPRCELAPRILESKVIAGEITRTLLELQVEPEIRMRCYLFVPPGDGPFPACVCLHSTSNETIRQPAGLGAQPEKAFGLDLARRGYVTIAPENFLWCYPIPPKEGKGWSGYHGRARALLEKYPGVKGMAKMVHDASRCVDYLLTLPSVRRNAIGAIGHSLGAKEVTYLMAFDERVACGVSSEGGVAFEFTNYHDPWYLGASIREEGFPLHAHEVVALIAPRPWLLIGGNSADGDKSWPWVAAALPIYRLLGAPGSCGLFVHGKGHAVPPGAREIAFRWLDHHLKRREGK